ncbi:hypothetical protein PIB30_038989 [Stylosanthes scabra]|uniref:Uncharacterized protein n=1 Tax=Stylosanthes scabra TaxID=79078 RepID=A0ABU6XEK3_9FABA|nr:hypothetical protein [Stylosanthes scabra]
MLSLRQQRTIECSKCLWGLCFHVGHWLTSRLTVVTRGVNYRRPDYQLSPRGSTNDDHPVLVLDRSDLAMITNRVSSPLFRYRFKLGKLAKRSFGFFESSISASSSLPLWLCGELGVKDDENRLLSIHPRSGVSPPRPGVMIFILRSLKQILTPRRQQAPTLRRPIPTPQRWHQNHHLRQAAPSTPKRLTLNAQRGDCLVLHQAQNQHLATHA